MLVKLNAYRHELLIAGDKEEADWSTNLETPPFKLSTNRKSATSINIFLPLVIINSQERCRLGYREHD